jgi:hypothetical protein
MSFAHCQAGPARVARPPAPRPPAPLQKRRSALPCPAPPLRPPAPRHIPRGPLPRRSSPMTMRRCLRRVSASFLVSSTFWVDFFTSPWGFLENILPPPARFRRPKVEGWAGKRLAQAAHSLRSLAGPGTADSSPLQARAATSTRLAPRFYGTSLRFQYGGSRLRALHRAREPRGGRRHHRPGHGLRAAEEERSAQPTTSLSLRPP